MDEVMKNTGSMINNKNVERLLSDIHRVLIRIEKHLLKFEPKKEDTKKKLLND